MQNGNTSFSNSLRYCASGWLVVCLVFTLLLVLLLPRTSVTGSVLALLPQQTMDSIPPALQDAFMQRLDRQLVWLVSPGLKDDSRVAQWWLDNLQGIDLLSHLQGPVSDIQQQAWGTFFYQHRNGMIDGQTRQRLAASQAQADWVMAQLYSTFSGISARELKKDPLLLVRGAQLASAPTSRLRMVQDWLVTEDDAGRLWYLIRGESSNSSWHVHQAHQLADRLQTLEQELHQRWPDAQVLSQGTLFYSDYASQLALHDIVTLGSVTCIGVLLLIYGVFRSLLPLLLCLLSISIGALAGTVATLLIFAELHLMTLVMSIGIVGISVDYAVYYLTERMIHGREVTPWQSLHKVLPTLLMALGTTVIACLIMLLAPFPGLRQLAVFTTAGLSASCLTVVCWYPWLSARLPVRPIPLRTLMTGWLSLWQQGRRLRIGLPAVLTLFTLIGLTRLTASDDIAQLQALPEDILQQERAIAALTGQSRDQKWFMIYGDSAEATLQQLEQFTPLLLNARQQGWLGNWRLIPLSSLARQREDLRLLRTAAPGVLARLISAGIITDPPDLRPMWVTPQAWEQSPVSEGWRLLWLSLANGLSAVLVPIEEVRDAGALATLAANQPGVSWIDRKGTFDSLFAFYRTLLGGLLMLALAVIMVGYVLYLGWRRGLLTVLPSLLSVGCALAVLAFMGYPLNLFSLLALILVLGIGINYTVFFSNRRTTALTALLAVMLAMSTTLLTLGMLVFSSTQAIRSFGLVLCSGIFSAFLLSPLALPTQEQQR